MGKLEEKKKQKRDAILKAAYEQFVVKGIQDTSISDITKSAELAKGTFYLYFKDKYEVRDELIRYYTVRLFNDAEKKLVDIDKLTYKECIVKIIESLIDHFIAQPDLLRFIDKNLSWGLVRELKIQDVDNKTPFEILSGLADKKGVRFRDQDILYFMTLEIVGSSCHASILYGIPTDVEHMKKELLTAVESLIDQFLIS